MDLRLQHCLLSLSSFLLTIFVGRVLGYETYYIERDCRSGRLNVSLSDGGPSSSVFLRTTEHTSYSIAMDCHIMFTAPESHRIVVSVLQIGFRFNSGGVTCKDYIKIYRIMCENLFRVDEERHYFSTDNTMEMLYYVSKDGMNNSTLSGYPGIQFTVTASKKKSKCQSLDDKEWFRCDNGYCIWSGLKCDAHNNCGDLSDEMDCGEGGGGKSTVLIILGGLILLLMVIMCVATLLCTKNERVRKFSSRIRSRTLTYLRRFSK